MTTLSALECQYYSSRNAPRRLFTVGDSYVAGVSGSGLTYSLRSAGEVVLDAAAGGASMADIRDQIINNAAMINRCNCLVVWDGSESPGYSDASAYADMLATGLAHITVPFIVIPAAVPYAGSTTNPVAIRNEFLSRWPTRMLEWRDYIANTDGVVDQDRMLNYPTDPTHLNTTAMDEISVGVAAMF